MDFPEINDILYTHCEKCDISGTFRCVGYTVNPLYNSLQYLTKPEKFLNKAVYQCNNCAFLLENPISGFEFAQLPFPA